MTATNEAPSDVSAGPVGPAVHLPPGYTVGGKYAIRRLLGEGANGAVYEGEHTQIGHRVAIKVVHQRLAGHEEIVERFAREARICGTIRSRNVGQVYDVGELPDGAPYMVMELHDGLSLAKVLADSGRLPIAAALDVSRQLLLGLQAAHDTGVIHRDVKPGNIMLVHEPNGHLQVKLVDFGIGKTVNTDISARNVTQEGEVVGSPDYMPPEALRGEEVDARADIYAAGVVLYEMVTGCMPFDAPSMTELFAAILRDPVKSPRVRRPDCPPQLERVIVKAMAREASGRYQRANEMREALERVRQECGFSAEQVTPNSLRPQPPLRSEPGASPDDWASDDADALELERVETAELKLPVHRTGSRIVVLGALLALAGVLAVWLWPSTPETPARRAPPMAAKAQAAPQPTAAAVPPAKSAAPEAPPAPAVEPAAPEPTTPAAPESAPAAVSGEDDRHHGQRRSADARGRRGAGAGAKDSATPARPEPPKPEAPEVNPAGLLQQAAAAFVRGQMPRARALYREASERAPSSAEAWRGLGMVSSRMGERSEAARAFKRYLTLRPNAPDAPAIQKKLAEL